MQVHQGTPVLLHQQVQARQGTVPAHREAVFRAALERPQAELLHREVRIPPETVQHRPEAQVRPEAVLFRREVRVPPEIIAARHQEAAVPHQAAAVRHQEAQAHLQEAAVLLRQAARTMDGSQLTRMTI